MKFKLFGRFRDDEQGGQQPQQDSGGFQANDMNTGTSNFSSGLEDTVQRMFSQGYSESEIRDELSGQYSEDEIQNAINRAVTSSAAGEDSNDSPEPMTPYQGSDSAVSPMDEGYDGNEDNDMGIDMDSGQDLSMDSPQQQQGGTDPNVEELVETIVAENFDRVENEFENAYSEIDELRERMDELEQRVHDLEVRDDEDDTQVIQKMDELEQDFNDYQSRIGGLEKAFQQVLPSLVDNVRDLTNLVQEIKQEKGIETDSSVSNDMDDIDMEDW
ncbi:MAG: hypothetical protein ABEJ98_05955 [Candidatus Nanohaloarchaea archaeon]